MCFSAQKKKKNSKRLTEIFCCKFFFSIELFRKDVRIRHLESRSMELAEMHTHKVNFLFPFGGVNFILLFLSTFLSHSLSVVTF